MSFSAPEVVKTTTGIFLRLLSSFISLRTSRPSFFGKFKSRKIISGRGEPENFPSPCKKRIASSPSSATCRLFLIFASSKTSSINPTSPSLSSTKRISTGFDKIIIYKLPHRTRELNVEDFSHILLRWLLHRHQSLFHTL